MADNIDHNTQTLDGLNTFHGMGMIKAVTPSIKCTSRIIPCVEVTAEDVAAVTKVGIHFYKELKSSILDVKILQQLAKMIILGTLIYFGRYHVFLLPYSSSLEWYCTTGSSWGISWSIFNKCSANDRHGSYKCIVHIFDATLCCRPG